MTKRVQIYVPDEVAERWKGLAAEEGIPVGHWVVDRVREAEGLIPYMKLITAQLTRFANTLEEGPRV